MRYNMFQIIAILTVLPVVAFLQSTIVVEVKNQENEAILRRGTLEQIRTVCVFDRGAVYGCKRAMRELQPKYEHLIHEAVARHDLALKIRAQQKKHHRRGK